MTSNIPRVFVTRTPRAAAQFIDELFLKISGVEERGKALEQSDVDRPETLIELVCTPIFEAELLAGTDLEAELRTLSTLTSGEYDTLTFTSRNGVRAFATLSSLLPTKIAPAQLVGTRNVVAVGAGTAHELENIGISVSFTPSIQDARHMVQQWPGKIIGERVLCVQGTNARDTLSSGLSQKGMQVDVLTTYQMSKYPAKAPLTSEDSSYRNLQAITLNQALKLVARQEGAKQEPAELLIATAPSLLRTFHERWRQSSNTAEHKFPHVIAIGESTATQAKELNLSTTVSSSPAAHDLASAVWSHLRKYQ